MDVWHETGELPSGKKWGRMGAMKHLIDDKGKPISKGYHEFLDDLVLEEKLGLSRV